MTDHSDTEVHAAMTLTLDLEELLESALREARPYVFNRTQGDDWRAQTAQGVLARVDTALRAVAQKRDPLQARADVMSR